MSDWQRARALLTQIGGFEAWVPVFTRSALARASIGLGELGAAYAVNDEAADLLRVSPAWAPLRAGVDSVRELIDRARNVELDQSRTVAHSGGDPGVEAPPDSLLARRDRGGAPRDPQHREKPSHLGVSQARGLLARTLSSEPAKLNLINSVVGEHTEPL